MPLPKRKHSHARTSQRRANNWKMEVPNVASCPRCHQPRLPHHVCPSCGFYGNRMVIDVRAHDHNHEDHDHAAGSDEHAAE